MTNDVDGLEFHFQTMKIQKYHTEIIQRKRKKKKKVIERMPMTAAYCEVQIEVGNCSIRVMSHKTRLEF